MFRSREQSELQASSSSHATVNRVLGPVLAQLLEQRQTLPTDSPKLADAAKAQGIDIAVLEQVARFVNAPSVKPGSERTKLDDQTVEHVEMTVRLCS
jgi:hypothetical protein